MIFGVIFSRVIFGTLSLIKREINWTNTLWTTITVVESELQSKWTVGDLFRIYGEADQEICGNDITGPLCDHDGDNGHKLAYIF